MPSAGAPAPGSAMPAMGVIDLVEAYATTIPSGDTATSDEWLGTITSSAGSLMVDRRGSVSGRCNHQPPSSVAPAAIAAEVAQTTLQTTALVNEIYVRMVDLRGVSWRDRAHFFALASRLIRRVLIDAARARSADKRGAGAPHVVLDDAVVAIERADDLVALDDALTALAALDARRAGSSSCDSSAG